VSLRSKGHRHASYTLPQMDSAQLAPPRGSGATMHNYAGHAVIKYGAQHPIALPEASDIDNAIHELKRP
jgi:hypothetical protein